MAAFVILSLALAAMAAGMVAVAVLALGRQGRALRAALGGTQGRLAPLVEELQDEVAVAALELDALQRRVARHTD